MKQKFNNLHILELDVTDEASYPRLDQEIRDVVKGNGLNLIINNAGVAANTPLHELTSEEMKRLYNTNTVAPIMITKGLLSLLRAASYASPELSGDMMCYKRAAVINISSRLGSIAENAGGKYYAYRASKVALNSVTRSLGIDLRSEHILVTSVDPGWVQTNMGGPNGKITAKQSAENIIDTLAKLGPQHTSLYLDNLGEPIAW